MLPRFGIIIAKSIAVPFFPILALFQGYVSWKLTDAISSFLTKTPRKVFIKFKWSKNWSKKIKMLCLSLRIDFSFPCENYSMRPPGGGKSNQMSQLIFEHIPVPSMQALVAATLTLREVDVFL